MHERGGRRAKQDERAEDASDDAGDEKRRQQAAGVRRESVAVRDRARERARPECDGVRRVRGNRRNASKNQRRKGDEAAASCDGVYSARNERGEKQKERMVDVRDVQAKEYRTRKGMSSGLSRRSHLRHPLAFLLYDLYTRVAVILSRCPSAAHAETN